MDSASSFPDVIRRALRNGRETNSGACSRFCRLALLDKVSVPLFKSARIVAAEVANEFVLAGLTFEIYEVYKPASVYEHMKEQTQPCQHWGTSWSGAPNRRGPHCGVFEQCCLHPDVTDITEHGNAPHRRLRRMVRRYLQFLRPNPENQSACAIPPGKPSL